MGFMIDLLNNADVPTGTHDIVFVRMSIEPEQKKPDPRQRLLDQAIEYVAEHGIGDVSLRTLAQALGTSHRMLIHHFGSKQGLWVAIVRAVEERQRALLRGMLAGLANSAVPGDGTTSGDTGPAGVGREELWAWWKHISNPSLWPNERLFFEVYGQALHGRPHTTEVLDGIVEDWVEPVAALNVARGIPARTARAHARLGVAVTRGLLLDLLATRDIVAVDAAMETLLDLYEAAGLLAS
jgi:AcrR family transcriptional regulator